MAPKPAAPAALRRFLAGISLLGVLFPAATTALPASASAAPVLLPQDPEGEPPPTPPPEPDQGRGRSEEEPIPPPSHTLLGDTEIGRFYDDLAAEKSEIVPLTIGAWHWFNWDLTGADDGGYGIDALPGTYFYYAQFSPEMELENETFEAVGAHVEFRIRDASKFRAFFRNQWWFYEAYGWVDTPAGRFKAGKLLNQFGLPWDNTFWGNTPYFDGFKLDPDWGVSWERSATDEPFSVGSAVQFFLRDDGVNGSITGGDLESAPLAHERDTGIVRVVPTWRFDDSSTLAVGWSGLVGRADYAIQDPQSDDTIVATAVDVKYSKGPYNVFGEAVYTHGVRNPARFVSGGPSKNIWAFLAGGDYTIDFCTLRAVYSVGFDDDPGGWEQLFVPGATLAVTENIDLYLEYVLWEVQAYGSSKSTFQNGFQFIINWRF